MQPWRVLIVDDHPLNVELASIALEGAAFVVDGVAEAEAVPARIAAFKPDLILMDIQLPGIDGLTLARAIKGDPATRHIVVVAFTAFAMKGDAARMREGGCDGYIAKPIDVLAFPDQVRAILIAAGASPPPQGR